MDAVSCLAFSYTMRSFRERAAMSWGLTFGPHALSWLDGVRTVVGLRSVARTLLLLSASELLCQHVPPKSPGLRTAQLKEALVSRHKPPMTTIKHFIKERPPPHLPTPRQKANKMFNSQKTYSTCDHPLVTQRPI